MMLSGVWFLAPSVEQTPREKICHIGRAHQYHTMRVTRVASSGNNSFDG